MEGEKILKDLEKQVKQFLTDTINDVRVEAAEMLDKNFQ